MFLKAVSIIYRGSIICIELGLVLGPGDVDSRPARTSRWPMKETPQGNTEQTQIFSVVKPTKGRKNRENG